MPENESKNFPPHPGTIRIHYEWNQSDQILNAAKLPDTRRFAYYDSAGQEVDNANLAHSRVPIQEEEVITLDANGKSVEPKHAIFCSIMQYGPNHKYLREIQASGTPQP